MSKKNRSFRFFMSFVLMVSTVLTGIIPSSAAGSTFKDVPSDAYYAKPVGWAVDKEITKGTSETTFSPDAGCTRGQCVTFLYRYAGSPEVEAEKASKFTDVKSDDFFVDAVAWAVENGVTSGTSETTFSPNKDCTRAQIVTFLWRFNKETKADQASSFTDVKSDAYYAGAVSWAVEQNITNGTSDTNFSPDNTCTRAQIVTFLYRMDQAFADDTVTIPYTEEIGQMIDANGGELPEIYLDQENSVPEGIIGTFSEKKVTDADSAIEAMEDISQLMQIDNVDEEFVETDTIQEDDTIIIRLQQMYNGCRVYGRQVIITSDAGGTILSMIADYDPLSGKVNETDKISMEQASQIAKEVCDDLDGSAEKILYTLEEGCNDFAWLFSGSMTVIVSAADGEVLDSWENYQASYTPINGRGRKGNYEGNEISIRTVLDNKDTSDPSDDRYLFYDSDRNMAYYDLNKTNIKKIKSYQLPGEKAEWQINILSSSNTYWSGDAVEKAITLYENLNRTYDYYEQVLHIRSYDNRGGLICAMVNDGLDWGKNAYSFDPVYNKDIKGNRVFLTFGHSANYQNNLDVVGHEFTHAVQKSLVHGLVYKRETGALMEAYSDIAGTLVELHALGHTDWIHANERNMSSPEKTGNPRFYKGDKWVSNERKDNGGVHQNSTVISNVIYKIYNKGINDTGKLSKLLYKTWEKLPSSGSFSHYAVCMMAAANELNFTQDELNIIRTSFLSASIKLKATSSLFSVKMLPKFHITDSNGDPVRNAVMTINSKLQYDITDINGYLTPAISLSDLTKTGNTVQVMASGCELFQDAYSVERLCRAMYGEQIEIQLQRYDRFKGHTYALSNEVMTWSSAKEFCERAGGHLVTITSEEEQAAVERLMKNSEILRKSYWIGGYYNENSWKWVTGESFDYSNWDTGEPNYRNNTPVAQIYARYYWDDTWNDGDHGGGIKEQGFICEWDDGLSHELNSGQ